ncbi:hypothetical protein Syun_011425 [Stephania yunnanensis]|uniref:Protein DETOXIFICATION n=1 Tax=Stephania yunnanensis TaxID=152371 RepID=A0AAP0JYJ4_9MAGN
MVEEKKCKRHKVTHHAQLVPCTYTFLSLNIHLTLAVISPSEASPHETHLYLSISVPINITKHNHKQKQKQNNKQQVEACDEYYDPRVWEVIINESKSLLQLSLPIALTSLVLYSRSILSMLFLGHLGDAELAAGSLAMAFANITGYSPSEPAATTSSPSPSNAPFSSSSPPPSPSPSSGSTSLPSSASSAKTPSSPPSSHTFLLFSLPDLLTHSFLHPIRIYLRSQGITRPLTLASAAASALHLPIAFLLVSRLNLGVSGVALASSLSNFLLLLFILFYLFIIFHDKTTFLFFFTSDCFKEWKPLLRLAAPSCVSVCLEWWWYEIIIVLCGLLVHPKAPLAAMGILIQTTSFIYIFPSSLGFAVSTRVGNELGANRPTKARAAAAVAVFMAALMGVSATLFAAGMKNVWGRMFTGDVEIRRLTAAALPILGLCEIGNCPQTVACGVLRGSARPSTAAHVNLGAFYLVGMPVAVLLGFGLGVGFSGLWLGLLSAQVCCAGLMLYVVGTTDWEVQAQRAQMLTCAEREQEPDEPRDGAMENGEPMTLYVWGVERGMILSPLKATKEGSNDLEYSSRQLCL